MASLGRDSGSTAESIDAEARLGRGVSRTHCDGKCCQVPLSACDSRSSDCDLEPAAYDFLVRLCPDKRFRNKSSHGTVKLEIPRCGRPPVTVESFFCQQSQFFNNGIKRAEESKHRSPNQIYSAEGKSRTPKLKTCYSRVWIEICDSSRLSS